MFQGWPWPAESMGGLKPAPVRLEQFVEGLDFDGFARLHARIFGR